MIELINTKDGVVASIKGDSHIGKWIREHDSIVTDQTVPVKLIPLIKEGDTVIEIGANIGSHTGQYAAKVGPTGKVIAYEPYLESFVCLKVNTRDYPQVECYLAAVGDEFENGGVAMDVPEGTNYGMARISKSRHGYVPMVRIDDAYLERCDFVKIDAEGYEPFILKGMIETIKRCQPILFVEINKSALANFGFKSGDILNTILNMRGYNIEGSPDLNAEQVDVLFLPNK